MVTNPEETGKVAGTSNPVDRAKTVINKTVVEAISRISSKVVIKVIVRRNLLVVDNNKIVLLQEQVDKTKAVIKETILTGKSAVEISPQDPVDKGKTVTGQTEVADNKEEVNSKGKIKIPEITAGIKNNEAYKY